MTRLLDADVMINILRKSNENHANNSREEVLLERNVRLVEEQAKYHPVIIEERPNGAWLYNRYDGNPNIGNWHCSECRHIVFGGYSQKPCYNFCPNCGADMREGEAE